MNPNLAVTLVGAIGAIITFVAGRMPEGAWSSGLLAFVDLINNGPVHDLLLVAAGAAVTLGFGRLVPSKPDAKGRAPDAQAVKAADLKQDEQIEAERLKRDE